VEDVRVRVEVERSGGFAGMVTRRSLDTAELPADEAGELRRLVAAADVAGLAQRLADAPAPPRGADRFQYDVTVHHGEQVDRVTVRDGSVPPELAPLLARVTRSPSSSGDQVSSGDQASSSRDQPSSGGDQGIPG
jgi:hypothetical protein